MRADFDIAAEIAAVQHGRVSRAQLVAAGVDRGRIQRWVADGRLIRVYESVFAVGHTAPSPYADLMAAVLACGHEACASHPSAGHHLGILKRRPALPHITVPTTAGRVRPGIVVHRVKELHTLDAMTWHGVRTTTPERTLFDLAPHVALTDLTRACHEAWIHHDTAPHDIEACIARNPRKRGATKLRLAYGSDVTLSILEDAFVALLRAHHLPLPRTNVDHHGDKVDCHWPRHGLTIELHSYRYHATRHAWEQDIARRRRANHIAYTYGDICERGARTAAEVRRLLARGHSSH